MSETSYLDLIRAACEPRRSTGRDGTNNDTPAWRVNAVLEQKALDKLLSRHKATTEEAKESIVKKIIDNIAAQKRYRKTLRGAKQFVSQPRQLSVYLNSDGFLDEFDTPTSELRATVAKPCHVVGCSGEGKYPHTDTLRVCEEHLRDSLDNNLLSDYWRVHYREETQQGRMLRLSKEMKECGATKESVHELMSFAKPLVKGFGKLPYDKQERFE